MSLLSNAAPPFSILQAATSSKLTKPGNIEELIEHVNDYAKSIPKELVYKAVRDIYVRAGCCLENGGAAFKSKLEKYKNNN